MDNGKTVKVKALWNIGYDGEGRPAGSIFWCDPEWAERKANPDRHFKKKVKILERKLPEEPTQEEPAPEPVSDQKEKVLLDINVREAAEIINNTDRIVLLDVWREEEKANSNLKTVLEAIDKQLDKLSEGGG